MINSIEQQLKESLQSEYINSDTFLRNIIFPVFGEENYESSGNLNVLRKRPELQSKADASGILEIRHLGGLYVEGSQLDIFDVKLDYKKQLRSNRVEIQQIIRAILDTHSGAFIIFHYESGARWEWRFTFCHKGASQIDSTDAKRYTFLLGPGQSCRTAAENFMKIHNKIEHEGEFEMSDIIKAFDVEALSKEFFEKYKVHYGRFVGHVIGKEYIDKGEGKGEWREKEGLTPSELFYGLKQDEKRVRDYIKKLLGRIVFLHFLQKKGWLGATDEEWTNGPQDFMLRLYENASADQQANFLDEILEPLFSCLDTPLNERREVFDTKVDGLRSLRVPFLGGLFERNEEDKSISIFPYDLFADLFKFLSEYNFTIDENDPNDAQVGVDPEMLGRIFENLLEDNKDKGAFYTPKEIVQYMCRESLIAYLQTDVTDEATREALRQFVTTHDVNVLGGKESPLALNVSQCLKDVKICDPAIGSGAFPMGLLNELFLCRGVIESFDNGAKIKEEIIKQNIYGVDIEKGAVDIARLRFWLSLITDADTPEVLPNMDFKIMQGNSLLEQYKGFDLSHIMDTKTEIQGGYQFTMFDTDLDNIRRVVKRTIKDYYGEQSHDMRRAMRQSVQQNIQRQIEVQGINVDISDIKDIASTDQFFLWHTWFSEVFEEGGFDIVIGNPPYGAKLSPNEKKYIKNVYTSAQTKNGLKGSSDTFSLFIEEGYNITCLKGICMFIVPLSVTASDAMSGLHNLLINKCEEVRISSYGDRPRRIFESAEQQISIIDFRKTESQSKHVYTSGINKRTSSESINVLFEDMHFTNAKEYIRRGRIPKIGYSIEGNILGHLNLIPTLLESLIGKGTVSIYYRKAGGRYYKLITKFPTYSSAEGAFTVESQYSDLVGACMSSNLYYWFWLIHSDWHNMRSSEIEMFPIPYDNFSKEDLCYITKLYTEYQDDLKKNSKVMSSGLHCYYARKSKDIIDKIDRFIGPKYGLSDEEIEFIINYDSKYRASDE